jgi:hypothetical protein
MRNKLKIVMTFMAMLTALIVLPGVSAFASEKTYSVTIRAGHVGDIDTSRVNATGSAEIAENYLRFTVNKGESLASAGIFASDSELNAFLHNVVVTDAEYMLLDVSGICDETITKNTEYVLDYARLVDPVSYSICYVDASSGEQIAAPTIAYGNVGDVLTDIAPVAIDGYATSDSAVSLTLKSDSENKVTFKYTSTYVAGTVTRVITVTTPGDTVTVVQDNGTTTEADAAGGVDNAGATNAAGADNVVVAGAANAAGANDDGLAPEGADADADDAAQIADDDVPLGADSDNLTSIDDEDVPLGTLETKHSGFAYVIGVIVALVLAASAVRITLKKMKN